ncbi:MAG: glucosaminidase domain-containing protein [Bacteroidales bacterium]
MSNKKWIMALLLGATCWTAQSKNKTYLDYIDTYKEIAISHSKKYKIPASITLAQGLLESNAGKSRLAKEGNNHFGIKCHSSWTGRRMYHDDDAKDECFRKYRDARDSYEDHAQFLTNGSRYAFLFNYKTTDYTSWAKGLSKAGYATDRHYPSKLIRIIEEYNLAVYDSKKGAEGFFFTHTTYTNQGLLYIEAFEDETIEMISEEFKISAKKIRKYNDMPKDYQPSAGDPVYLEGKRSKTKSDDRTHIVQSGESMYSIAQKYGIKLKSLYKMNKKSNDYAVQEGDTLKLR